MAHSPPKRSQKRPISPTGGTLPTAQKRPGRQKRPAAVASRAKSPSRPKTARGGARPGAGRPPRDTVPVTVRLHPSTLALLSTENRSREIEYAILAFFRNHLQVLREAPGVLDEDHTHTWRSRQTGRFAPSPKFRSGSHAGRTYVRQLTRKLRAAEGAFAADAPRR